MKLIMISISLFFLALAGCAVVPVGPYDAYDGPYYSSYYYTGYYHAGPRHYGPGPGRYHHSSRYHHR